MSGLEFQFKGTKGAFELDADVSAPGRGVTALFGPSGSGKTTLLRAVAGLEHFAGKCQVGDVPWQDSDAGVLLPTHKRALGYVFQEASLFPHLSVTGNLLFGSKRATRRNADASFVFEDIVEMIGLAPLLDRPTAALSGGERQRVAIGRALMAQPNLLLMDEPLSALDRRARTEILPYLERLHKQLSIPILYVSHDLSEVARLADYIVVLDQGTVADQGPLGAVLERLDLDDPADRFEAGVVVDAKVHNHDTQYQLTELALADERLFLPKMDEDIGQVVRLRIRARDVALATEVPKNTSVRNVLGGKILDIHSDQRTAFTEVLLQTGGTKLRARITRASAADLELSVGMDVFALIKSITFERRGDAPT